MAMVIKTNMPSLKALNTLNRNSKAMTKSLAKVSSGMKINSAADDASGYAISERMRVQVRGLDQDIANTQNASSMMRTAEGAVNSTVNALKTLKEKALNAANDSNTDLDRATMQKEVDQYIEQIDDNANMTFNGKYLFDGSVDAATTVKQTIIKALNSEWIDSSLSLIKEAYGLSFTEDDTSVRTMDMDFENSGGTTLAYVLSEFTGNKTTKLSMRVNMDFYDKLNQTDVNGSTSTAGAGYLDRTIAHELTHAVMSANIDNFADLPLYISEGAAELTHGIDDERKTALKGMTAANYTDMFASGGTAGTEQPYAGGYAFLRYLNVKGAHDHTMQRFMRVLDEQGGTAIDAAVSAATKGAFKTLAEATTQFMADLNASSSNVAFYKNYCGIDLDNPDTGSITGADAWGGDEETAESIVPEGESSNYWYYPSSSTSLIDGLTVEWPGFDRPDAGFRFQIGTKANQIVKAAFSDIHAEALGLLSKDGKTVSVSTRADAKDALAVFDKAIEKALNQQTTIGAIQSRLDYTSANLTTASENVQQAESTIRDADMAKEMTEYTKNSVLLQASQSMLSQADQNSSTVLGLLKG